MLSVTSSHRQLSLKGYPDQVTPSEGNPVNQAAATSQTIAFLTGETQNESLTPARRLACQAALLKLQKTHGKSLN